jgi:S1-C subfamily serine protease
MARDYLASERIFQRAHIEHGNSGGPSFDGAQNLRAVAANRISKTKSLFIPADKVKAAIEEPEQKFKFNYQTLADGNTKLTSIERLDGSKTAPIVLLAGKEKAPEIEGKKQSDANRAGLAESVFGGLGIGIRNLLQNSAPDLTENPAGRENFRNPLLRLNYYEQKAKL